MCLIGKTELLCMKFRAIGPHLAASGKSHGFSRVGWEPGVYCCGKVGTALQNSCLFSDIRTPV